MKNERHLPMMGVGPIPENPAACDRHSSDYVGSVSVDIYGRIDEMYGGAVV